MHPVLARLSKDIKDKTKKRPQPESTSPMLATLTNQRFSDPNWIFERKLDGERCLAFKKGNKLSLMSRNKKELKLQYPEISKALQKQDGDFIVDGEIVAFEGSTTSFSKLQQRMHRNTTKNSTPVYYYLFDILQLDAYDVSMMPLRSRKTILKKAMDFSVKSLRYTTHRNTEGKKLYADACNKHWEGLIAKDAKAQYVHSRSKKWLKFKCVNQQELVICGYSKPQGRRKYFGALIVGYYNNKKLKYAGKVGTGYDEQSLKMLFEKMKPLQQNNTPFKKDEVEDDDDIQWLKPMLVGEFQFTEWTKDDKLRHPSFLGLRDDKRSKDVSQEKK